MVKTLWFKPQGSPAITGEPINYELKEHALGANDWAHRDGVATLHEWAGRFNSEFRLGLETPAIGIDRMPIRSFGTYRQKRNGLGVRHEITLNAAHSARPLAERLATLLHESLHQWQEQYGKAGNNGYHNQQFRVMAKRFGLIVDDRGHHMGIEPGLFTNLLSHHNIDTGTLPVADEKPVFAKRPRGNSKLKKWRCLCTNVRCAVELGARCLKCGAVFEEDRPAW